MKSVKKLFIATITGTAIMLTSTSCKKCESDDNVDSGLITEVDNYQDVVIYPGSGYLTSNGVHHFTANTNYSGGFEISFDRGYTKIPYLDVAGTYDILANAMLIDCEASFDRQVYYEPTGNVVTYKVVARTCPDCENKRTVENYVLVPKISPGYVVNLEQEIISE